MSCGGGHLGYPIGIKKKFFVKDLPMIIPGQFGFNCSGAFLLTCLTLMLKDSFDKLKLV
jgi:hypothetical protein